MSVSITDAKKNAISECRAALDRIDDCQSEALVEALLAAEQVFFVGVGRVLLSLQSICKRLAHLGLKAHYVGEITEPAITPNDLLIVGSASGESLFRLQLRKKQRRWERKLLGSGPIRKAPRPALPITSSEYQYSPSLVGRMN